MQLVDLTEEETKFSEVDGWAKILNQCILGILGVFVTQIAQIFFARAEGAHGGLSFFEGGPAQNSSFMNQWFWRNFKLLNFSFGSETQRGACNESVFPA